MEYRFRGREKKEESWKENDLSCFSVKLRLTVGKGSDGRWQERRRRVCGRWERKSGNIDGGQQVAVVSVLSWFSGRWNWSELRRSKRRILYYCTGNELIFSRASSGATHWGCNWTDKLSVMNSDDHFNCLQRSGVLAASFAQDNLFVGIAGNSEFDGIIGKVNENLHGDSLRYSGSMKKSYRR